MAFVNAGEKRILINVLVSGDHREQLLAALAAEAVVPASRLGPMLQLETGQLGPFNIRVRVHALTHGEGPIAVMERLDQLKSADAVLLAGPNAEAVRGALSDAGRPALPEVVWNQGQSANAAMGATLKPVLMGLRG